MNLLGNDVTAWMRAAAVFTVWFLVLPFAKLLVTEAEVAVSPGVGFGPDGDGHVRFAMIENEQRTAQAIRNLRRALVKLC